MRKRVLVLAGAAAVNLSGIALVVHHQAPAAATAIAHHPAAHVWVPRTFPPEASRDDTVHITAAGPPVPVLPLPPAPTTTTTAAPTTTTSSSTTTSTTSAPAEPSGYSTSCYPSTGMAPRNSTEACISRREHGGCYDASANPSHSGRWQMTESLFYSYGPPKPSSPNEAWREWRYASPSAQDAAFRGVVQHEGYGNWTPYDGC